MPRLTPSPAAMALLSTLPVPTALTSPNAYRPQDPAEAQPDPCHHQVIPGLANITVPSAVGPTGNGSSDAAHSVPLLVSLPHYCQVG